MSRVRAPDGAPKENLDGTRKAGRNGPLVKRSRHRPLTPVTGVRFPHGSPGIMTAKVVHYIKTDAVLCESKGKVRWTLRQMSRPLAEQLAKSVLMARRIHPFPSRTRKLSYAALKILGGKLPGKIGRCRHKYSSLAQVVEHAAVNRRVARSSRAGGARRAFSSVG